MIVLLWFQDLKGRSSHLQMSWNYYQPKKPRFNHTNNSGSIKPTRRGLPILEKVVVYTASLANRYSGKIMLTNTSLIFFFFQ